MNTPSGPDPRVRLFDFEPPTYSGAVQGLALNGQNGFINPVPASSVSANVHVLTGNSLQLPGNSAGGSQFAGARGPGDGNFVRSQTPTSFASSSTNSCSVSADCAAGDVCRSGACVAPTAWRICFDLAVANDGPRPAAPVIGSLSLLSGTSNVMIARANWSDPETAQNWDAGYDLYDAAGVTATAVCRSGLSTGSWWRWCTTINLQNNRVLNCSLESLGASTSSASGAVINDRFLIGGSAAAAAPNSLRLFVGGSSAIAGNSMGFDNVRISAAGIFADGFESQVGSR